MTLYVAKVSLDRINSFLHNVSPSSLLSSSWPVTSSLLQTELLDEYEAVKRGVVHDAFTRFLPEDGTIGIKQTTFTWANNGASSSSLSTPATPGSGRRQRNFVLNVDGEVQFRRGQINLVVGPTGSGKTSLLMALLGTNI